MLSLPPSYIWHSSPTRRPPWTTLNINDSTDLTLGRGHYVSVIGEKKKKTYLFYPYKALSDFADPTRELDELHPRDKKNLMSPYIMTAKEGTQLVHFDRELVVRWNVLEESRGIGMDPYDIITVFYARAVLDHTCAYTLSPRTNSYSIGTTKLALFPSTMVKLLDNMMNKRQWSAGAADGPRMTVTFISSLPPSSPSAIIVSSSAPRGSSPDSVSSTSTMAEDRRPAKKARRNDWDSRLGASASQAIVLSDGEDDERRRRLVLSTGANKKKNKVCIDFHLHKQT